jgi:hypothetical protein
MIGRSAADAPKIAGGLPVTGGLTVMFLARVAVSR